MWKKTGRGTEKPRDGCRGRAGRRCGGDGLSRCWDSLWSCCIGRRGNRYWNWRGADTGGVCAFPFWMTLRKSRGVGGRRESSLQERTPVACVFPSFTRSLWIHVHPGHGSGDCCALTSKLARLFPTGLWGTEENGKGLSFCLGKIWQTTSSFFFFFF